MQNTEDMFKLYNKMEMINFLHESPTSQFPKTPLDSEARFDLSTRIREIYVCCEHKTYLSMLETP